MYDTPYSKEQCSYYKSAYIFFQERGESETGKGWYVDCYPCRKKWEPTTILGPFKNWKAAADAVDKAP